jgi:hypothetical protein
VSKPVIALVIATLTCGSASAYLWQELRSERAQTQTLQTRVAELERAQAARPRVEQATIETPPPAPSEPVVASAPATPKKPPAATFGVAPSIAFASPAGRAGAMDPESRRRMQEGFERQQKMLQDPEYRELMRSQHKMSMKRMYGDMELMLGLSKEDADRVLDILSEQQLRGMEQRPYMADVNGAPDEATIREQQRAFTEMKRRNDAELAAALGPKYGEWQAYQENMWSRSQVTRLRETLAGSDEPLRQDQIKPLVQALAREQQQMQVTRARPQVPPGGRMTPDMQLRMQEEWLERTAQSHERIRNAVSSLLSPAQLQQLQDQQDQERKMQELNLRMQRASLAEAQARGEDPTNEAQLGISSGTMILR